MRAVKFFLLAMAAVVGLILGGCGGGNDSYPIIAYGGKFLYVNNDAAANAVSAFRIKANGMLEEIAGSPFATGGAGSEGGYFAANNIAIARQKKLLFASNTNDDTISVFAINATTGELAPVGAPVASGGDMSGSYPSGSLAVDGDEKFLFVGNDGDNTISVFSIAAGGALTPVAGSPFDIGASGVDGITLNTKGKGLYIAAPISNQIVVMNVADDGALTPIAGSPFDYLAGGSVASFVLATPSIGLSGALGGVISSYSIDVTGAPTLLDSLVLGSNSQAISTARRGSLAFLSGGGGNQISVLRVASDGTLTVVDGSPFATDWWTSGYAVPNFTGRYLYVTEEDQIEAFRINLDGGLTSIGVAVLNNPGYATCAVIY